MEKLLIGSLELTTTKSGKQVIELYSTNTALQFPELRLFDLSALVAVGIDPNTLTPGERVHRRFWAYYTTSEKLNNAGNPYRDVAHLEAIDQPATSTSTDTTEILAALRQMNDLLQVIATAVGADPHRPRTDDAMPDDPVQAAIVEAMTGTVGPIHQHYRYANGLACSANQAERDAFDAYLTANGEKPADVDALRDWFQNHGS